MFVFDLETHNHKEFPEAFAAELCDVNRLRDNWDRDLTFAEIVMEEENVTVFDASHEHPVMNMLENSSEIHDGVERTYIDKDGDEIASSYRLLLVANNNSGFDSWAALKSLVKVLSDLKIIRSARGLISLSLRCGVKIQLNYLNINPITITLFKNRSFK